MEVPLYPQSPVSPDSRMVMFLGFGLGSLHILAKQTTGALHLFREE